MTPGKEQWNWQVCQGKGIESMHGQEEQDVEVW